jgi:hypothetical protein
MTGLQFSIDIDRMKSDVYWLLQALDTLLVVIDQMEQAAAKLRAIDARLRKLARAAE